MSKYLLIESAPYFADLQAQPEALAALLREGIPESLNPLIDLMADFDRIILTGMGSSLNALYPSFLRLSAAGFPVWHEDSAELLINLPGRVRGKTLFWIASQSGESAESIQLIQNLKTLKGDITVMGFTNDPESTLGVNADFLCPIHCGPEMTVSSKSYLNTLCAAGIFTSKILNTPVDPEILKAPQILKEYLVDWTKHFEELDDLIKQETIFVIGRGESMAAARTGSLIVKEAARESIEGLTTAQFRHGPLEMASSKVAVFIYEGKGEQRNLNSLMYSDLERLGAHPIWISSENKPLHDGMIAPALSSDLLRPLSEIIIMQLLSLVLAFRKGDEPGKFRQISKITKTL
jgi:glucosamine--fructose-6-phosphate aminotransferase (isomerizing)